MPLLVAAAMSVAVVLAFGIARLKFETGQDTLLDPGSKISRDNARFQSQFGGDPIGAVPLAPGGALDPAQLEEQIVQAPAFGRAGRDPHGRVARDSAAVRAS